MRSAGRLGAEGRVPADEAGPAEAQAVTVEPRLDDRDRPLSSSERLFLCALVCVAAAAYAAVSILRHWHFGSSGWDLGIQDQAIWQMSRLEWPYSSFQDLPYAADHFDPILLLVVPVYWAWPRPEALLVVQGLALASAAIPVFLVARRRLPDPLARVIAVAYLFFWGTQRTVLFDFHELAFAAPAVAWALVALERRSWRLFGITVAWLLLVKEDQPLTVIGLGGLLFVRGERRAGVVTTAVGLAVMAALLLWWLPTMAGGHGWQDADRYSYLADPGAVVRSLLGHPQRLELVLMYFAPWLFLPLLSPLTLAGVPLMASRLLSATPQHWMAAFHYTAPLAPVLAMAAADGWSRLRARAPVWRQPGRTRAIGGLMLAICVLQPGSQSVLRLLWPATYRFADWERRLPEVSKLVPPHASLVAQDAVAPHFSQRARIWTLDARDRDADFVVACLHATPWPNADAGAVRQLIDRWRRTHDPVYERDGWIVLERRRPAGTLK